MVKTHIAKCFPYCTKWGLKGRSGQLSLFLTGRKLNITMSKTIHLFLIKLFRKHRCDTVWIYLRSLLLSPHPTGSCSFHHLLPHLHFSLLPPLGVLWSLVWALKALPKSSQNLMHLTWILVAIFLRIIAACSRAGCFLSARGVWWLCAQCK